MQQSTSPDAKPSQPTSRVKCTKRLSLLTRQELVQCFGNDENADEQSQHAASQASHHDFSPRAVADTAEGFAPSVKQSCSAETNIDNNKMKTKKFQWKRLLFLRSPQRKNEDNPSAHHIGQEIRRKTFNGLPTQGENAAKLERAQTHHLSSSVAPPLHPSEEPANDFRNPVGEDSDSSSRRADKKKSLARQLTKTRDSNHRRSTFWSRLLQSFGKTVNSFEDKVSDALSSSVQESPEQQDLRIEINKHNVGKSSSTQGGSSSDRRDLDLSSFGTLGQLNEQHKGMYWGSLPNVKLGSALAAWNESSSSGKVVFKRSGTSNHQLPDSRQTESHGVLEMRNREGVLAALANASTARRGGYDASGNVDNIRVRSLRLLGGIRLGGSEDWRNEDEECPWGVKVDEDSDRTPSAAGSRNFRMSGLAAAVSSGKKARRRERSGKWESINSTESDFEQTNKEGSETEVEMFHDPFIEFAVGNTRQPTRPFTRVRKSLHTTSQP